MGWRVHIACSTSDDVVAFEALSAIPGLEVHSLPMKRPPRIGADVKSLKNWVQLIRAIRPDVTVASTPKAGLLATIAAKLLRVPVRIYHMRGLRLEGLSGVAKALSYISEFVSIWAATQVLVDSPSLRSSARGLGLLPLNKGVVLGHGSCCGVNVNWFYPASKRERSLSRHKFRLEETDFAIGYVGRITFDKGISDLLIATMLVREALPNVKLVLMGPIEDGELEDDIRLRLREGWLRYVPPSSHTREVYWGLDLFVMPSYREGFPIAPLEAQACGLPVMTTSATGCRDSIVPQETGLLVPPGDPPALRDALVTYVSGGRDRRIDGASCREWVASNFSNSSVDSRLAKFIQDEYQSLL